MAKLISKAEYNTVNIFGVEFEVLKGLWVAVDKDGEVFAYSDKPWLCSSCFNCEGGHYELGKIKLEPHENWSESLMEVK